MNAHQDKIARSCDSTGESTPRQATTTTPRSIIRHAGRPIEGEILTTLHGVQRILVLPLDWRRTNRKIESKRAHPGAAGPATGWGAFEVSLQVGPGGLALRGTY